MLASSIPAKFPVVWGVNATSSYIRVIPTTTADPTAASLSLGWPPDTGTPTGSGGTPPDIRDENGILNEIVAWVQWLNAGGPVFYDGTFSTAIGGYPKGTVLDNALNNAAFWISTADNNSSDPDTGGANWIGYTPVNKAVVDSGTANALAVTLTTGETSLAQLTGKPIWIIKSSSANTGASVLAVNGLTGTAIQYADGTAIGSGDLPASEPFQVMYDGMVFILQSLTGATQIGNLGGGLVRGGVTGTVTGAGGTGSTSFATAFPNSCTAVVITALSSSGSAQARDRVTTISASGFTLQNNGNNSAFYYVAFGK